MKRCVRRDRGQTLGVGQRREWISPGNDKHRAVKTRRRLFEVAGAKAAQPQPQHGEIRHRARGIASRGKTVAHPLVKIQARPAGDETDHTIRIHSFTGRGRDGNPAAHAVTRQDERPRAETLQQKREIALLAVTETGADATRFAMASKVVEDDTPAKLNPGLDLREHVDP